jgi:hypothetical protein
MWTHPKSVCKNICCSFCCLFLLTSHSILLSQAIGEKQAEASNDWMKQIPMTSRDSPAVSPEQRARRDAFADNSFGSIEPLTPDTAARTHVSGGSVVYGKGSVPEIPPVGPESAVIVARFSSYTAVLSSTHRSVYTEIALIIQQVVHVGDDPLRSGDVITVLHPGGTVLLPEGRVLSYLTDRESFSLQPNHTYLLVVSRKPDGHFYVVDKAWDVSTGVVRPNDLYESIRSRKGESQLAGLPLDAAVSLLKKTTD